MISKVIDLDTAIIALTIIVVGILTAMMLAANWPRPRN